MQTRQGSLGKKFTVGGAHACSLCMLSNPASGNDLVRTQNGRAHGNNLNLAEHGFWGLWEGDRDFSQRNSETGNKSRKGNAALVTISVESLCICWLILPTEARSAVLLIQTTRIAKLGLRAVLAGGFICFAKFSPMTLYLRAFFFVVFFTCVFALVTLPHKPSSSIT